MSTDLLYSQVEEDLRAAVRDLLSDRCPPASVLEGCTSDVSFDRERSAALWSELASAIGVAGLLVPESAGGHGASQREVAAVAEELGRGVAPVPFLTNSVATAILLAAGSSETRERELAALAAGRRTVVPAVALSHGPAADFPGAVAVSEDGSLDGRVTGVADGMSADDFLVPAVRAGQCRWYLVGADGVSGVSVAPETPLDMTRPPATVTLHGVVGELVGDADRAPSMLRAGSRCGLATLASEQVGLAQWCLDETVAYLKQRYQFGRPVGSFQALKHRMADVYLDLVTARAAARYAAAQLAGDTEDGEQGDADVACALAAAQCGRVAVHAAEECIQLHGGIGMTWEHPAHLYLKRAKSDELAFGTPDAHMARLAGLVDLPVA